MKKGKLLCFLSILFIICFFTINNHFISVSASVSARTSQEEAFLTIVDENYESYVIYYAGSYDTNYDLTIVIGKIRSEYYISAFIYVNGFINYNLNVDVNGARKIALRKDRAASFHKIDLKEDDCNIYTSQGQMVVAAEKHTITKENADTLFNEGFIEGKGNNNFPFNQFLISLFVLLNWGILVSMVFTVTIIVITIFIVKKRYRSYLVKQLSEEKKFENMPFTFEDIKEDDNEKVIFQAPPIVYHQPPLNNNPVFSPDDQKTKVEIEKELFVKRQMGIISDAQLDSALRDLWGNDEED